MKKADEACKLMHNNKYKEDMWMWDQDWSTQRLKLKKQPTKSTSKKAVSNTEETDLISLDNEIKSVDSEVIQDNLLKDNKPKNMVAPEILNVIDKSECLKTKFSHLFELKKLLTVVRPLLPGYPAWYRKLCNKFKKNEKWSPGPINITTSMQVSVHPIFTINLLIFNT